MTGDASKAEDNSVRIANKCPSCGWQSLFIGSGGWITCGNITDCKQPDLDEAIAARISAAGKSLMSDSPSNPSQELATLLIELKIVNQEHLNLRLH